MTKNIKGEIWYAADVIEKYKAELAMTEELYIHSVRMSETYFEIIQEQDNMIIELAGRLNKKWWQFWK